jgi:hypothetical protein
VGDLQFIGPDRRPHSLSVGRPACCAVAKILARSDIKERLGTLGLEAIGSTADEFAKYIDAESAKSGQMSDHPRREDQGGVKVPPRGASRRWAARYTATSHTGASLCEPARQTHLFGARCSVYLEPQYDALDITPQYAFGESVGPEIETVGLRT